MESTGVPGRIQVSRTTYERVHDLGYKFKEKEVEVKGKGIMKTYLLSKKHHRGAVLTVQEHPVFDDVDLEISRTTFEGQPLFKSIIESRRNSGAGIPAQIVETLLYDEPFPVPNELI